MIEYSGIGTKESPIRYHVNEDLLHEVKVGRWNTGMLNALVSEVERLLPRDRILTEIEKMVETITVDSVQCNLRGYLAEARRRVEENEA